MTLRKLFLCMAVIAVGAMSALAAERLTFEPKAFQSALDAGRPILVHVTAPWCAECKAQKPIVAELAQTSAFSGLTLFDVDYDTQKEALRQLNVQKQSTLVVFRGKTEVARAVGITRRDTIEALMRKAL
jgi:thioredoxin 1